MRIIYGINPVIEAIKAGKEIEKIVISREKGGRGGRGGEGGGAASGIQRAARERGIPVEAVDTGEIERMAPGARHQGVIALLRGEFRYSSLEDLITAWKGSGEQALFLMLDSIVDPQNLGSLVRAASAAGAHGVIIPKDRACDVTAAVAKASAGATEHVAIARETNLVRTIERLKEEGVWVAAIEGDCTDGLFAADLKRDLALVIGSEGKGIRRLVRENCDLCLSIPMKGKINSLNAAQAGVVALFEARRQRFE